jgi:predicted deacylase
MTDRAPPESTVAARLRNRIVAAAILCGLLVVGTLAFLLLRRPGTERLTIMNGTRYETTAYHIGRGNPAVFVLGGVHGDEPEGRRSAERLLKARVSEGTLVVSPDSNKVAIRKAAREGTKDLNRCFPGDASGAGEDRLAAELWAIMQERDADLLLTLHSSPGNHQQDPFWYGQTVMVDDPAEVGVADAVVEQVNRETAAPSERFTVLVEAMPTTATYEVYKRLGIPAYGLEVYRGLGLETAVRCHLRLIKGFCDRVGLKIDNWDEIIGDGD